MNNLILKETNEIEILFDALSENEGFARVAVAAFMTEMNPTLEEVSDVKTAVSEAVTNAIIHGYGGVKEREESGKNKVRLHCSIAGRSIRISVEDKGVGIEDIHKAMEPLYTSKPELERSGMGFAFMEAFMDDLEVESEPGKGCIVKMMKKIGAEYSPYR